MTKSINILEEYRKRDLDKRLNLFLQCPSLRTEFLEIDQSEPAGESLYFTAREEDLEGIEKDIHIESFPSLEHEVDSTAELVG